jgi:outer membrane protein assembly factor BamB
MTVGPHWRLCLQRGKWFVPVLVILQLVACAPVPSKPYGQLARLTDGKPVKRHWVMVFVAERDSSGRGHKLAVSEDTVYRVNQRGLVSAFDRENGKYLWKTHTGRRLIGDPGIADDALLLGTRDGSLLALRRDSGAVLWETPVSSEILAAPRYAAGRALVHTVDGKIIAMGAKDGSWLWQYDSAVPLLSLHGTSSPGVMPDRVLGGLANGKLVVLNLEDGQVRWQYNVAVPTGRSELERMVDVDATPLHRDGTVFAAAFNGRVVALTARTGRLIWSRDMSSSVDMAVDDSRLFVTDNDGLVWALDQKNGAVLWKQDDLQFRQVTGPAVAGDYVAVADVEGYVHWLDRFTGQFVARHRVDHRPVDNPPVAVNNTIYVTSRGGVIDALEVPGNQ